MPSDRPAVAEQDHPAVGGPDPSTLIPSADVYELQLSLLQEQLVSAMIDNETMKAELAELKTKSKIESLVKDLEYERDKNKELNKLLKVSGRGAEKQSDGGLVRGQSTGPKVHDASDSQQLSGELSDKSTDGSKLEIHAHAQERSERRYEWVEWAQDWLATVVYELIADFTQDADPDLTHSRGNEPLTVKLLKDNISRFKSSAAHIYRFFKGVYNLLSWQAPLSTLVVFVMYITAVWYGWLVPVLFSLAILRLTINYLIMRGWNIRVSFLAEPEAEESDKDAAAPNDLALSDRFLLVVDVARKVQNLLGDMADWLEKLKNLLTWRAPDAARRLVLVLLVGLLLSCILPGTTLFLIAGLYVGVKLFLVDCLFMRFPRLKQRHDGAYRLWRQLPTDAALAEVERLRLSQRNHPDRKQHQRIKVSNSNSSSSGGVGGGAGGCSSGEEVAGSEMGELTDEDRRFCTAFDLPLSERPLHGWQNGWRATLLDKSKPFFRSLSRNGRLYLTNSYLCMERKSDVVLNKNIAIPLKDITGMEKTKPYSWLPGSGMSIEVSVAGFEQPYTFSAIVGRDDCFDCLVSYCSGLGLPWAVALFSSAQHQQQRSRGTPQRDTKDVMYYRGESVRGLQEGSYLLSELHARIDYDDLTTFAE